MAITPNDIKLLESEVMGDTTDGGGRRTSRIIPDGVPGNIFPKVSRLDAVYGRVNLRKIFGAVRTANVDTYAGAHAIVTDPPDNARIHTTLFSTGSEFDTRTAARDRIESYVTSGPESRMILVGRQLPGQQTFLAYQRVEEPLPEVGDVYCLSNEAGSVVSSQQYVRVQSVDHEVRTYEDPNGTFQRRIVTVDVGVALRYEFNGHETPVRTSNTTRSSRVRTTTVVDAARYYGIQKLSAPAAQNDLVVRVQSVYAPIVPTTNREAPVSNAGLGDALNLVACSTVQQSESLTAFSVGVSRSTRRGILPGSLTLSGSGVPAVTDDKKGSITSAAFQATVDYENGTITRTGGTAGSATVTANYTPAVAASQPIHTTDIRVTLNNRGTVYAITLNPLPSPGSVIVDYRALGKWYRLRDDGAGSLTGDDPAYGVGTIIYATGSAVLTLGALPDVDTSVLVSHGSPAHYAIRAGATSNASTKMRQSFTLPDVPINPNSFALTYIASGIEYPATDNAAGQITGDGITGTVNYTTGAVELEYSTRLPDAETTVSCTYQQIIPADPAVPVVRSLSTDSKAVTELADAIDPGSMVGSLRFRGNAQKLTFEGTVVIQDNGSGAIIAPGNQRLVTSNGGTAVLPNQDQLIGTIDYSTGTVTVNSPVMVSVVKYETYVLGGSGGAGGWGDPITVNAVVTGGPANFGWRSSAAAGSNTAKTYAASFTTAPITLDMTATVGDRVVPGSLMFSAGGKTFIDRNGVLYADVSASTGAGVSAGSVDYSTGKLSLTNWTNGAALNLSVTCCLTQYGEHDAFEVQFRTPGSPLRPGSFYVQATDTLGNLLAASSNDSGVITNAEFSGAVDQETGVVRLKFGKMVTAAGNEGADWFDPAAVVDGQIFKPNYIMPSTLSYNAVILANLPLNADILGLDPVRLPMDGRVPIYRPADVVVIHNTKATTLPNPVTAGQTYSAGRAGLSEMWLEDSTGKRASEGDYVADLDAGSVTIAADFTGAGLTQPLKIKHRIEDMALATDIQINGQIALAAPLPRAYDDDSYLSSALLFGDMAARATNVHDLLAFSAWTDTPGTQANAQFNNIDYPIEVLNNGAVTERWRINFTNTTGFQVIGENVGVIATGTTAEDCSPTNALTGLPYFVIRAAGWGSGWSAGNNLRFNTVSAAAPIWIARTILPGATLKGDAFSLQLRGDVDAE